MSYWFASQNFTLEPSVVVINRPSWLTSALVTGDLVSSVWTIFPLLTSHNLLRGGTNQEHKIHLTFNTCFDKVLVKYIVQLNIILIRVLQKSAGKFLETCRG